MPFLADRIWNPIIQIAPPKEPQSSSINFVRDMVVMHLRQHRESVRPQQWQDMEVSRHHGRLKSLGGPWTTLFVALEGHCRPSITIISALSLLLMIKYVMTHHKYVSTLLTQRVGPLQISDWRANGWAWRSRISGLEATRLASTSINDLLHRLGYALLTSLHCSENNRYHHSNFSAQKPEPAVVGFLHLCVWLL